MPSCFNISLVCGLSTRHCFHICKYTSLNPRIIGEIVSLLASFQAQFGDAGLDHLRFCCVVCNVEIDICTIYVIIHVFCMVLVATCLFVNTMHC